MYWTNASFGYVKDHIVYKEDPQGLPDYQKEAGFQIGQTRSQLTNEFMNNWNDLLRPILYINSEKLQTVTMALTQFQSQYMNS